MGSPRFQTWGGAGPRRSRLPSPPQVETWGYRRLSLKGRSKGSLFETHYTRCKGRRTGRRPPASGAFADSPPIHRDAFDAGMRKLWGAHPKSWPLAEAREMVRDHLNLTTQGVVAHLKQDWTASIAAYDEIPLRSLPKTPFGKSL